MTEIHNFTTARQDEDGTPYLAYFDPDLHMAFMWSGHPESPITVSTEGMNGPVAFEIPPTLNLGAIQSPAMLLREFRFVCNEWADTIDQANAELGRITEAGSIRNGVVTITHKVES